MVTPDQFRWAEALSLEKLHGEAGAHFVAERIGAQALASDESGVERFLQIADRLKAHMCGTGPSA